MSQLKGRHGEDVLKQDEHSMRASEKCPQPQVAMAHFSFCSVLSERVRFYLI